jgi:3-hydroxyacyl-CoA dehydrogenase
VPNEVPQSDPAPTIALIGATPIAELIAARALRANLNVIIDDISDAHLQATSIHLRDVVGAQPRCAPGPQDQPDSPQSGSSSLPVGASITHHPLPNLLLTQSIESAIRQSDFLIDALPDDLEVKLELFTLFDKFAKPSAIFITTGSIPIDDLAAIIFCPDRCLAVRLTDTTSINAAFELIPAKQTSARTLDSCTNLFLHSFAFREK